MKTYNILFKFYAIDTKKVKIFTQIIRVFGNFLKI